MSIIQKIQEKGAWIVFILIALALIAFIMMDSSVRGGLGNSTTVGKVNGTTIKIDEFQQKVSDVEKNANSQNMPHSQVITGVWNYFVQSTLLKQAYEQLGLVSTSKDMDLALFGNNPPPFLRNFVNPETGQYDVNAARNALAQLKKSGNSQQKQMVNEYLDQQQEQIMMAKYQSMVFGAAYIPSWLLNKTMADDNAIAQVQYVAVPYSTISDSAVSVSDADINSYVQDHKKLFEQKEETRNISYLTFNAAASTADSAAIKNTLQELSGDFASAKDNAAFVASKDGNTQFYDGYMSAAAMQFPNKELVIGTPVDSVSAPYISNGNYVVSKMVAKTVIPDSARVRHILVATHQQDQSSGQLYQVRDDSSALKRLDSAIAEIKAGANFDSVALKYSDDPGSASTGGVIDYFTSGRMLPEFNNFAFTGHTGESKTIHTSFGYHFVEILGQKGSTEGYKIASVGRQIIPSQQTIDSVSNVAATFVASNQTFSQMEAGAKKDNKALLPAQGIKQNDFQVGNLGESRDLVKWIYDHKVGEVSQPVEIGDNFVVAAITNISKAGLPSAATVRPYLEQLLKNKKKAKLIIDSKFKGSTLEDYAKSAGVEVATLDSLTFDASFVPRMGNEPALVGAAFNKDLLNKVSKPFAGTMGVFAIKPLNVSAKSSLEGPEAVEGRMKQTWFQQIQNRILAALQTSAKIEDDRSTFF
ncbi:peptidyl-prolyl cis-trans isomerase D [Arachidicoccus rhizosphaerae]|uniref:Periplasmic chaperone PpiD n=1 Tax=Arachidicoccus rhizosphaerae TaxID=551991 RepID=A0A1H3VG20_9BACT|nr:peptidylprolyl isomerase [Arachidicoccus rhizosphaerae]SDZ73699.1 peptidyl-prolyl cis-trans isomerase D [Arachidicoccus rhizosphaerae]